jgi:hypothetical protein
MLKKHLTVSEGIEQSLDQGLAARNRLIHRVLIDNVAQFARAETRAALVKEIRALRRKVNKGDKLLGPFILVFNEVLDGVTTQSVE